MANKRPSKVKKSAPKRKRGRGQQRRQRARGAPRQSSSIGRMLCKGVQTLASLIPGYGKAIAGGLDFLFRAIGQTSSRITPGGYATIKDVQICQMQAVFEPCVGALISGSRAAQVEYKSGTTNQTVVTSFSEIRIRSMTIEVMPNNPIEKRAGEITLSFQPYFLESDAKSPTFTDVLPLSQPAMRRQYLCTSGPADMPLSLTYKPRVTDGYAYGFRPVTQPPDGTDDVIGQCCILYRNLARDSFAEFKPSEFHCQVVISCEIEARTVSGLPFRYEVKRRVIDTQNAAYMIVVGSNGPFYLKKESQMKLTSNDLNSVDVYGEFVQCSTRASADFEMVEA